MLEDVKVTDIPGGARFEAQGEGDYPFLPETEWAELTRLTEEMGEVVSQYNEGRDSGSRLHFFVQFSHDAPSDDDLPTFVSTTQSSGSGGFMLAVKDTVTTTIERSLNRLFERDGAGEFAPLLAAVLGGFRDR